METIEMETINEHELNRRIDYWKQVLGKLENHMMREQSERADIKNRLTHLHKLR